jgi:hypothetical protein
MSQLHQSTSSGSLEGVENIFIVTSVITSKNRTFYTPEQRLEQTCETAKTIAKYCPGAWTLLIEGSEGLPEDMLATLKGSFNEVIQTPESLRNLITYCNISVGECTLLQVGFNHISRLPFTSAKRVFKLSGRHLLTDDFAPENYPTDKYGFGQHFQAESSPHPKWGNIYTPQDPMDPTCYLTVLFSVPFGKVKDFLTYIQSVNYDIEHDLFARIPKDQVHILPVLGFCGNYGANGVYYRR